MPNTFLYTNNAVTTLASSITNVATSATLATGSGALFPNPSAGQQFPITFTDAATGLLNEIVYCTARSGDVITIVRAQEGTSALAWSAGDVAALFVTAGCLTAAQQVTAMNSAIQLQTGNYAVATGTNTYAITLSPVPASYTALIGVPIRVLFTNAQTLNTCSLNVNTLGAKSLVRPANNAGGTTLFYQDILANNIQTVVYDGTNFELIDLTGVAMMGAGVARGTTVPNTNSATTICGAVQGTVVVSGDDTLGNSFSDLVTFTQGATTAKISATQGSPGTRTYTMSASNLQMALTGATSGATPVNPRFIQSIQPTP